jgi:hypothetical protein
MRLVPIVMIGKLCRWRELAFSALKPNARVFWFVVARESPLNQRNNRRLSSNCG